MPEIRVGLLDISDDNPGVTQATIFSTEGLRIHDEDGIQGQLNVQLFAGTFLTKCIALSFRTETR